MIKPRQKLPRKYADGYEEEYLESDRDFMENNRDACVDFLESGGKISSAEAFKILFDNMDLIADFNFFEENGLFDEPSFFVCGDTVTPIKFKDGSKAEYCDGDYTVKE